MSANRPHPASANSTARRNRNRTVVVSSADEVTLVTLDQKVTQLGQTVTTLNETVTVLSQSVAGILTTVQTMQDFMVRKFDAIDGRFEAIDRKFEAVDKRFEAVDKRFEAIDKRFEAVDKRFDTLQDRVQGIEKTMSRFDAYMKTEARIQEGHDIQFIIKLYYHNYPTHMVDRLNVRDFYRPNQMILTDFDGLLLIRNVSLPLTQPLRPIDLTEYIIIESKHSLDKAKVDKKIEQMTDLSAYLAQADDEKFLEASSPKFQESIRTLLRESKLSVDLLDRPIHLIFASDDISHEVGMYIRAISRGFKNEADYDNVTKAMFDSDPYVQPIMERIRTMRDRRIRPAIREMIQPGASMARIREAFVNHLPFLIEAPIKPYLTPYSALERYFEARKGRIGLSQFGLVEYSPLFPAKGLNRNIYNDNGDGADPALPAYIS
jgi:uncharacterized protein YoxC